MQFEDNFTRIHHRGDAREEKRKCTW